MQCWCRAHFNQAAQISGAEMPLSLHHLKPMLIHPFRPIPSATPLSLLIADSFFPLLFFPHLVLRSRVECNTLRFQVWLKGNMEINWLRLLAAFCTCLYSVRGAVQLPFHCSSLSATCLLACVSLAALGLGAGDGCPLPLPVLQKGGQLAGLSLWGLKLSSFDLK